MVSWLSQLGPGQRAWDPDPADGAGHRYGEPQLPVGFQRFDQAVERAYVQADAQRAAAPNPGDPITFK
jgi:hypothetical protein